MDAQMMKNIATGNLRLALDRKAVRRFRVGGAFRKREFFSLAPVGKPTRAHSPAQPLYTVFHHCIKYASKLRPDMEDVVRRLELIIKKGEAEALPGESTAASQKKQSLHLPTLSVKQRPVTKRRPRDANANPWARGSKVATCLETFISRIEDEEARAKLEEVIKSVGEVLGAHAVDPVLGIYTPPRIYRYLRINEMDTEDTKDMLLLNANARVEFKMDDMRKRIVQDDLCYDTIPRIEELRKCESARVPRKMNS